MILELGCGENPDPRSDLRVDHRQIETVDVRCDLNSFPWPFGDNIVSGVIAHHILEHINGVRAMFEIARILEPGGTLEIKYPIGTMKDRDPTHQNFWNYDTFEYFALYTGTPAEYDPEKPPLVLQDREFTSLWFSTPGLTKLSPLLRLFANRFPGVWTESWSIGGELTVRFSSVA